MFSKIQLIKIRNFYISNFFVNINCILYKNHYIETNNVILFYLLKCTPLFFYKMITYFFNIKFIYNYDNIYNVTGTTKYNILPYIFNFTFYENKNDKQISYDISNSIKYYNSAVPFKYILLKNHIKNCNYFKIKYLTKNNFIEKELYIKDYENKLICDLFKNN
jgi:hypothetical protein